MLLVVKCVHVQLSQRTGVRFPESSTTSCNSSSRESNALFWLPRVDQHICDTLNTQSDTYIEINNIYLHTFTNMCMHRLAHTHT